MNGILDNKVEDAISTSMLEAGWKESEVHKIILTQKKKELKNAVTKKLQQVISFLNKDSYDKIEECTEFSPAGDGYGLDNHYISFKEETGMEDIMEIVRELKSIDEQLKCN